MIRPTPVARIPVKRACAVLGAHARTHYALTTPFLNRPPKLSVDEARILPRFRAPDELVERAQMTRSQGQALASAARPGVSKMPPGGDPIQLRGIPAIGRGVSGAVRGSQPEQAILFAFA